MVAAVDSVLERLSAAGVRQVAVTWDNHAGETLVKVVPLRHLPEAIGVSASHRSRMPFAPMV